MRTILAMTAALAWASSGGKKLAVVALGDSTTAGTPYFRSPAEAPPDGAGDATAPYTHEMVRLRPDWKVHNRGVNGERTDQIRARWPQQVEALKPDYVIILGGVNDVYQGRSARATQRDLSWMYERAKAAGIAAVAVSVLPFSAATPEQSSRIRALNAWIKKRAGELGIPYCDLHALVADPAHPDRLKGSPDGLHPDTASYRAMGAALARRIEELESAKAAATR